MSTNANNPGHSSSDTNKSTQQENENAGACAQVNQAQAMQVREREVLIWNLTVFTDAALNTVLAEALYNTETKARIFINLVENAISSENKYKDEDNKIARDKASMIISALGKSLEKTGFEVSTISPTFSRNKRGLNNQADVNAETGVLKQEHRKT